MRFLKKGIIPLISAAVLLALVQTSCKTCNCPAYTRNEEGSVILAGTSAKTTPIMHQQLNPLKSFLYHYII